MATYIVGDIQITDPACLSGSYTARSGVNCPVWRARDRGWRRRSICWRAIYRLNGSSSSNFRPLMRPGDGISLRTIRRR